MTVTALRFYDAIGLAFPDGAIMPPPGASAAAPDCICCRRSSPLPPGKLGWLTTDGAEALFLVCSPCADECADECADDAQLEEKVLTAIRLDASPVPAASPATVEAIAAAAPTVDICPPPGAAEGAALASEASPPIAPWVAAAALEWAAARRPGH